MQMMAATGGHALLGMLHELGRHSACRPSRNAMRCC